MRFYRDPAYWRIEHGTIALTWWRPMRMWGLSVHGAPCCRLWFELGPLEFGWLRWGAPEEGK